MLLLQCHLYYPAPLSGAVLEPFFGAAYVNTELASLVAVDHAVAVTIDPVLQLVWQSVPLAMRYGAVCCGHEGEALDCGASALEEFANLLQATGTSRLEGVKKTE